MTCRHGPGDLACGRYSNYAEAATPVTPDASKYEIDNIERVGPHLVLRVKYPNCSKCSYEGMKVMVFLNVREVDVLRWRKIDPHFRRTATIAGPQEAPSPSGRFPASPEGWQDAVDYAHGKLRQEGK